MLGLVWLAFVASFAGAGAENVHLDSSCPVPTCNRPTEGCEPYIVIQTPYTLPDGKHCVACPQFICRCESIATCPNNTKTCDETEDPLELQPDLAFMKAQGCVGCSEFECRGKEEPEITQCSFLECTIGDPVCPGGYELITIPGAVLRTGADPQFCHACSTSFCA